MPYTQEAALQHGTTIKAALAASKVRLFKSSLAPNPTTLKTEFVAAEADYDGYAAGGLAVAAFNGPSNNPTGGAAITSPLVYFTWVLDVDSIGNMVGGWWLELAAGGMWAYTVFPQPIAMAAPGDAIPLIIQLLEGVNP